MFEFMAVSVPNSRAIMLRQVLQRDTRDLHDRLDSSLGAVSLASEREYAQFLSVQYAARAGIEVWAEEHMSDDLRPPAVSPLIAADLAKLGEPTPAAHPFEFPRGADPLGVGWALGGSALGNKAMLTRRRRAGSTNAELFLSDPSTAAFFRSLLPRLERCVSPQEADGAVAGARAVFQTFLGAMSPDALQAVA